MAAPAPQGGGGPGVGGSGAQGSSLPPYQMNRDDRRMLQYTTDFFDHYWTSFGALQQCMAEDRAGTRAAIYERMQVPRRRAQPRTADDRPAGAPLDVTVSRAKYAANVAAQLDQLVEKINLGAYDVIQYARPLGLDLTKVLGQGGFGIACLFEFTYVDGTRRNIVVKASSNWNDISQEITHINRMAGANHIVQRIFFRDLPGAQLGSLQGGDPVAPTGPTSKDEAPQWTRPANVARLFDGQENMFAMEYMRNGDIYRLLRKAGALGAQVKDQDLWEVLHCLFRGILGMAYPRFYADGKDPVLEIVPQQYERIVLRDGQPRTTDRGIVHFDLDIQNTMIGDLDDRHGSVPIIKIGDLGCGEQIQPADRDRFDLMLQYRRRGKFTTFTPEQNTKDWDYVDRPPRLLGERVAGNYDWWTNLYQAAQVMWHLITGFGPDLPPQVEKASFRTPTGVDVNFWTYGALLLQQIPETVNHDPDLRATVAWCMAVSPDDRPKMDELEAILLHKCDPAQWTNPELGADLKGSILQILNAAPG